MDSLEEYRKKIKLMMEYKEPDPENIDLETEEVIKPQKKKPKKKQEQIFVIPPDPQTKK